MQLYSLLRIHQPTFASFKHMKITILSYNHQLLKLCMIRMMKLKEIDFKNQTTCNEGLQQQTSPKENMIRFHKAFKFTSAVYVVKPGLWKSNQRIVRIAFFLVSCPIHPTRVDSSEALDDSTRFRTDRKSRPWNNYAWTFLVLKTWLQTCVDSCDVHNDSTLHP